MNQGWNQLDLARRGDESAWRGLVDRHSPRLLRMLSLMTGSPAAAQDIVQETFLKLYRKAPRHSRGSLGCYVSTIAYHLALKEKRRSRNIVPLEDIDPPAADPSPLDNAIAGERERCISEILGSLDEGHRDVLILRFYGGHSYREIAGISGLPLGTVKSRMFNAMKKCLARLREKGVTR